MTPQAGNRTAIRRGPIAPGDSHVQTTSPNDPQGGLHPVTVVRTPPGDQHPKDQRDRSCRENRIQWSTPRGRREMDALRADHAGRITQDQPRQTNYVGRPGQERSGQERPGQEGPGEERSGQEESRREGTGVLG